MTQAELSRALALLDEIERYLQRPRSHDDEKEQLRAELVDANRQLGVLTEGIKRVWDRMGIRI